MVSLNISDKLIPPEQSIEGLEGDELKEAIKDWFLSNFEDPAESTPYESREGGYQYIWGGPYDAREQIEGYFGDAIPEEIVEAVVQDLENDVVDWAPHGNRIYDEDPPEDDYANLQRSLDILEERLAEVRSVSPAIGDNNPPESIGVPPYTSDDEGEIRQLIKLLREPEPVLSQNADNILQAATLFRTRGEKIRDFFTAQGKKFADGFSGQMGKRAADAIWLGLAAALLGAYNAVWSLLSHAMSNPPF
ncbi:HEPN-associated N-terminal domain-containing protein [Bradyrhizobium sp. OK095]|uniref:HEPN-associated N-terminal domain-containing protein n=1 Tax=Bradyrhizobium sp. OK095 TaxID=1882760 RepID=UPI00115FFD3B|nr:HEPN-associated N-terminal domain-containing protein [Bradyrhizobium sp. OK095]